MTATVLENAIPHAAPADDVVARAATRLYDAEIALHIARQTRVDAWVAAAYDRLHEAVCAHRAAAAATGAALGARR